MFNFKDFRSGTAPNQTTQSQRRRNDDIEKKENSSFRAKSRSGADLSHLNSDIKFSRQGNIQIDNEFKNNNTESSSFSFFGNKRDSTPSRTLGNIFPIKDKLKTTTSITDVQPKNKQESRRKKSSSINSNTNMTNQMPSSPKQQSQRLSNAIYKDYDNNKLLSSGINSPVFMNFDGNIYNIN